MVTDLGISLPPGREEHPLDIVDPGH